MSGESEKIDKVKEIGRIRAKAEESENDLNRFLKAEEEKKEDDEKELLRINEYINDSQMDRRLVAIYEEIKEMYVSLLKVREELEGEIRRNIAGLGLEREEKTKELSSDE